MQYRGSKWLTEQIAVQCAPLLAGLKPSNLLIIPAGMEIELKELLKKTIFSSALLMEYDGKQVYLLYTANELVVYLTEKAVRELLKELGYEKGELNSLIQRVSAKYRAHIQEKAPFPHELGLLLGYPAVDVRGFMEHSGKDFLFSGYWKVYGNAGETKKLFVEFGRAKEYIMHMVNRGYSIAEISVMYHKAQAYA